MQSDSAAMLMWSATWARLHKIIGVLAIAITTLCRTRFSTGPGHLADRGCRVDCLLQLSIHQLTVQLGYRSCSKKHHGP